MVQYNEMTEGLDLPPSLINANIYRRYEVMTKSTVSQKKSKSKSTKKINVELGKKYGRLTVISEIHRYIYPSGQKHRQFECLCECGNTIPVDFGNLRSGNTKSCGCLKREILSKKAKIHGLSTHPLYYVWGSMVRRCSNPEDNAYNDYGGRGIGICEEWIDDFKTFFNWAIENGWRKGLWMDRIENNDGYFPENIRFVDAGLSSRNQQLLQSNNTSGYAGVSYDKCRQLWKAEVRGNGVKYYFRLFKTAVEAAKARDKKVRELNMGHPLNFNLS